MLFTIILHVRYLICGRNLAQFTLHVHSVNTSTVVAFKFVTKYMSICRKRNLCSHEEFKARNNHENSFQSLALCLYFY